MKQPISACAFRCRNPCARSMSRRPRRWYWARPCARPTDTKPWPDGGLVVQHDRVVATPADRHRFANFRRDVRAARDLDAEFHAADVDLVAIVLPLENHSANDAV